MDHVRLNWVAIQFTERGSPSYSPVHRHPDLDLVLVVRVAVRIVSSTGDVGTNLPLGEGQVLGDLVNEIAVEKEGETVLDGMGIGVSGQGTLRVVGVCSGRSAAGRSGWYTPLDAVQGLQRRSMGPRGALPARVLERRHGACRRPSKPRIIR